MTDHYRQGDVYVSKVPGSVNLGKRIPEEKRGVVLAWGEVNNHAHVLDPTKVELYELPPELRSDTSDVANGRILRVLEPVDLRHEEHGPITLQPGDYYVGVQLEYDDMAEWRRVAD